MRRAIVIFAVLSTLALARSPEGQLAALRIPNDARPVICAPGDTFQALAVTAGTLHLVSDGARVPLQSEWASDADGSASARCSIPKDVRPGVYALEWSSGDEADITNRAVFVFDALPDRYTFATVHTDQSDFQESIATLDASAHQFALVFLNGDAERCSATLDALGSCRLPTYLVWNASVADRLQWTGPATYVFTYGPDAYLVLDTGPTGLQDAIGSTPATVAKLRRTHKRARWAVAVLPDFGPSIAMRNTMTLFVDDPVHTVISGSNAESVSAVDWAGWYESIPVYSPRERGITYFSATLKGVAPFTPKPAAKP